MILKADIIKQEFEKGLKIVPRPDFSVLEEKGNASIDFRLGRWFLSMRQTRTSLLEIEKGTRKDPKRDDDSHFSLAKEHFVPFGSRFVLHPTKFILGITLEWICLPHNLSAYVTGKSSWSRRGLIIETAAGIHPGFSGCIALEMTNIGEIPIEIKPGAEICQVFIHRVEGSKARSHSDFSCRRKPYVGLIREDVVLEKLGTSL